MLVAQRNDVARTARVFLMGRRSRLVFCVPRRQSAMQSAGFVRIFCCFCSFIQLKSNKNTEQKRDLGAAPEHRRARFAVRFLLVRVYPE